MTKKSRTNLGREKLMLGVAVLGLLKALVELVTKVVSYVGCYTQLRLQIPAEA